MFQEIDNIYLLNLEKRADRLNECVMQSLEHDFTFEIIKGVDGDKLNLKELLNKKIINDEFYSPDGHHLSMGVYGCALSHYNAYKKMIEDNVEMTLIFEDDFVINTIFNSKRYYENIKDEIFSTNWDILFLGKNKTHVKGEYVTEHLLKTDESWVHTNVDEREIATAPYKLWGAHGYIVKRKAAQYLLDHTLPIRMPADTWLQYLSYKSELNILCTDHSIVMQTSEYELEKRELEGQEFTYQEKKLMIDSDTIWNRNKRGDLYWLQMPEFTESIKKEKEFFVFKLKK
jgi:GR25 family glycosyltransferase involved in LPS biosynthesis